MNFIFHLLSSCHTLIKQQASERQPPFKDWDFETSFSSCKDWDFETSFSKKVNLKEHITTFYFTTKEMFATNFKGSRLKKSVGKRWLIPKKTVQTISTEHTTYLPKTPPVMCTLNIPLPNCLTHHFHLVVQYQRRRRMEWIVKWLPKILFSFSASNFHTYLGSPPSCSGMDWCRLPFVWIQKEIHKYPRASARGGSADPASATHGSRWRGEGPSCAKPAAGRPRSAG